MKSGTRHPSAFLSRPAWAAVIVVVASAALISSCAQRLPSYRYRLTVEVQTPEGPRVGSSVVQVDTRGGSGVPDKGISSRVIGQAVSVDLGSRGMLFALLSSLDDADLAAGIAPTALLPALVDRRGTAEAWGNNLRALKQVRGTATVPRSWYPLLVRFRDIAHPSTIEKVNPSDLEASFGRGVHLSQISIEITNDNVTSGISRLFPWWSEYLDRHFNGTSSFTFDARNQDLAARLSSRSFSTES